MKGKDAPAKTIEELHIRYAGAIYDKCIRMLADRGEAEDAVQETFVRAYQLIVDKRLKPKCSRLAWLYRIATYTCLHALRTRRRKGLRPIGDPAEVVTFGETDQDLRLHFRQQLERILLELDEKGQAILVAHYVDGIPQGEIALSLDISRRAVVKRLTALKKKVGHLLEGEHDHA